MTANDESPQQPGAPAGQPPPNRSLLLLVAAMLAAWLGFLLYVAVTG